MGQKRKRDRKLKTLIWSPAITFALNQLSFSSFLVMLSKHKKIKRNTCYFTVFKEGPFVRLLDQKPGTVFRDCSRIINEKFFTHFLN